MDESKEAIVIKIGERFYHRHTPKRVITAWSLAGAQLFLEGNAIKISDVEDFLKKRGYKSTRGIVKLIE